MFALTKRCVNARRLQLGHSLQRGRGLATSEIDLVAR